MDLSNPALIITLAITTLCLVVAYAVWQRIRVSKAKSENATSAIMENPRHTHNEERVVKR